MDLTDSLVSYQPPSIDLPNSTLVNKEIQKPDFWNKSPAQDPELSPIEFDVWLHTDFQSQMEDLH